VNLSETAKIQDGDEVPLWRFACVDPAAEARCSVAAREHLRYTWLYHRQPATTTPHIGFRPHLIIQINSHICSIEITILTRNSEIMGRNSTSLRKNNEQLLFKSAFPPGLFLQGWKRVEKDCGRSGTLRANVSDLLNRCMCRHHRLTVSSFVFSFSIFV